MQSILQLMRNIPREFIYYCPQTVWHICLFIRFTNPPEDWQNRNLKVSIIPTRPFIFDRWDEWPVFLYLPLSSPHRSQGSLCCGRPSSSGPCTRGKAARFASPTIRPSSWRRSSTHRSTCPRRRGRGWPRCCSSASGRWERMLVLLSSLTAELTSFRPQIKYFKNSNHNF